MLLAIDTSDQQASIALCEGGDTLSEWSWTAGRNHSRQLTGAIYRLLDVEGVPLGALTGIVVAIGPGSFSGVRVGISEAKGLALALAVPLAGISTLDVLALAASEGSDDVWALVPAGRGDVALARYAGNPSAWRRVSPYMLLPAARAAVLLEGAHAAVGPAAWEVAALMPDGSRPVIPDGPWKLRRAGYLAELGRRYLEGGGPDQRSELEPLYLRPSAAEEQRPVRGQE